MLSTAVMAGDVTFPSFTKERVYMAKFFKKTGLPSYLKRWQKTVDAMLNLVETDNPIFIMIDQGVVKPQQSHRRPGVHIDGYWCEELHSHHGTGGHIMSTKAGWQGGSGWVTSGELTAPEAIILASDYSSAIGYTGEWDGTIGEGGDLSHLDLSQMNRIRLQANKVYIGNVGFVHESVPVTEEVNRTLVRLNVKNWEYSSKH